MKFCLFVLAISLCTLSAKADSRAIIESLAHGMMGAQRPNPDGNEWKKYMGQLEKLSEGDMEGLTYMINGVVRPRKMTSEQFNEFRKALEEVKQARANLQYCIENGFGKASTDIASAFDEYLRELAIAYHTDGNLDLEQAIMMEKILTAYREGRQKGHPERSDELLPGDKRVEKAMAAMVPGLQITDAQREIVQQKILESEKFPYQTNPEPATSGKWLVRLNAVKGSLSSADHGGEPCIFFAENKKKTEAANSKEPKGMPNQYSPNNSNPNVPSNPYMQQYDPKFYNMQKYGYPPLELGRPLTSEELFRQLGPNLALPKSMRPFPDEKDGLFERKEQAPKPNHSQETRKPKPIPGGIGVKGLPQQKDPLNPHNDY